MPRRKNKYDQLRAEIISDLKDRGVYRKIDEHLVDDYVSQKRIVDALLSLIEEDGVTVDGARGAEEVANPALVRLPSAQSQLVSMQKQLGIGPYSRKLTTGSDSKKKPTTLTSAAMLRPINHRKKAK